MYVCMMYLYKYAYGRPQYAVFRKLATGINCIHYLSLPVID